MTKAVILSSSTKCEQSKKRNIKRETNKIIGRTTTVHFIRGGWQLASGTLFEMSVNLKWKKLGDKNVAFINRVKQTILIASINKICRLD
jgi:hypothetical protein